VLPDAWHLQPHTPWCAGTVARGMPAWSVSLHQHRARPDEHPGDSRGDHSLPPSPVKGSVCRACTAAAPARCRPAARRDGPGSPPRADCRRAAAWHVADSSAGAGSTCPLRAALQAWCARFRAEGCAWAGLPARRGHHPAPDRACPRPARAQPADCTPGRPALPAAV